MGYQTYFEGSFDLDKPLTAEHTKILKDFNEKRHNDTAKNKYPGIWCQWEPNEDGTALIWDEGEKFYEYEAWIEYLIDNYLKPWGYVLNGVVSWDGDDSEDNGDITIEDNIVEAVNLGDLMAQQREALDEILKRIPKQLPLLMGINKLLDKKLKTIFEAAAKNPASTAALILCGIIVTKFITL